MKKLPTAFLIKIYFVLFFIGIISKSFSQSISKINTNPSDVFTYICAYEGNNAFFFNYTFNPPSFFTGTTFNLLISDANGLFPAVNNVVATSISSGSTTNKIKFYVPTNFVGGNNYKFKIQSTTTPVISSPETDSFEVYYRVFVDPFSINDNQPLTLCGNTTGVLSIDDPTAEPASISYLKYNWFRNNVLIPNQKGISIPVNAAGTYYCQVDYGTLGCTNLGAGDLNRGVSTPEITVNIATGGSNTVISSSNPSNFVTEGAPATLSTENNPLFFYQWYKDGVVLNGETTTSLTTNIEGTYYLEIYSGICTNKSNEIQLILKKPSLATVIPNLISPNGDGVNDVWEIPEIYSSNLIPNSANITIRDSNGKLVYETDNYIGDWPQTGFDFNGINPIFYYLISAKNGDVKKGTITIVK